MSLLAAPGLARSRCDLGRTVEAQAVVAEVTTLEPSRITRDNASTVDVETPVHVLVTRAQNML